jgi:phenylalanyl-tRNA synthetase alpha chain
MDTRKELEKLAGGSTELAVVIKESLEALDRSMSQSEIDGVRTSLIGKKGHITEIFKRLKDVPDKDRPETGRIANMLRGYVEGELELKVTRLKESEEEETLKRIALDVTLPGRRQPAGHKHLLTQVVEEVTAAFISLGYSIESGPEVELDYYNFEALNTPAYHPARSLLDTFYVRKSDPDINSPEDVLLRTHTSPVQVRVMESRTPPLYVISPGKAYRREAIDATHTAMFFQVEGFAVDRDINMGHLKGTLEVVARRLFGSGRKVRFRPHFFPFTEPSAEVDVSCHACDGHGCALCKGVGWLEILGCGMIDPNVFEYVGYDPEKFTGFAFGMGVERIAMLKYGIEDIRLFYENDVRFLSQF